MGGLERLTPWAGVNEKTCVATGDEEPALNPVAVMMQEAALVTRLCAVYTSQPYQTLWSENDFVSGPVVKELGGLGARPTFMPE